MDTISHALKNIIRAADDPEMRAAFAPAAWRRAAGEELARHTAFISLENSRMTIAVADAMWKKQLDKMAARLVYLCSRELGEGSVKFVEFIIAPEQIATRAVSANSAGIDTAAAEVTPDLKNAAANISNEKLREAFLGAAANSLSRKKRRGNL